MGGLHPGIVGFLPLKCAYAHSCLHWTDYIAILPSNTVHNIYGGYWLVLNPL
jgi:hypothetical protein